jgi:hypothetical protein
MKPYKFAETATPQPPLDSKAGIYFTRLENGEELNRKEKDELFHLLYGNSGKTNYMLSGWIFPFGQFFKTFIVKYNHTPGQWTEIKAPDKTAIRASFYTNTGIIDIKELN